jgi:hypothetical protein
MFRGSFHLQNHRRAQYHPHEVSSTPNPAHSNRVQEILIGPIVSSTRPAPADAEALFCSDNQRFIALGDAQTKGPIVSLLLSIGQLNFPTALRRARSTGLER